MTDDALRKRLDLAIALLALNCALLLGIAFHVTPETALGVGVLAALVGYGHHRSGE